MNHVKVTFNYRVSEDAIRIGVIITNHATDVTNPRFKGVIMYIKNSNDCYSIHILSHYKYMVSVFDQQYISTIFKKTISEKEIFLGTILNNNISVYLKNNNASIYRSFLS